MTKGKIATIEEFEGQSGELLRTAFAMCEAGISDSDIYGPKLPQRALEAAAESLQASAKTFAAVAKACKKPVK